MRVGRVIAVDEFPEARKPAWKLTIDFGPEIGDQAFLGPDHALLREELQDTLVVAVVNFPPRQIGPFMSEVLVLGALDDEQRGGAAAARPRRRAAGRGSADPVAGALGLRAALSADDERPRALPSTRIR